MEDKTPYAICTRIALGTDKTQMHLDLYRNFLLMFEKYHGDQLNTLVLELIRISQFHIHIFPKYRSRNL